MVSLGIILLAVIFIGIYFFIAVISEREKMRNSEVNEANTGKIEKTDWEKAKDLLHGGQVLKIFQTHDLNVTFKLKDGSKFRFKEPKIDAIFDEVKKCEGCGKIIMATE